jgi:hypothetical protein
MKKSIKNIESDPMIKADKVKQLVIEKENALHSIEEMMSHITELKGRIGEIDSELNSLLELNIKLYSYDRERSRCIESSIPKKGLVRDMAKVMSDSEPMTIIEIVERLKSLENQKGEINLNSIRSYLTNLACFKCIKKSDTNYPGKGWICLKEMLK